MTTTLITGANKGLGLETARRLIEAGHTVYAGMRDTAKGADAEALGARIVQLDVTDDASVQAALAGIPSLDVLINNAGIVGRASAPRSSAPTNCTQCSTPTSSRSCG